MRVFRWVINLVLLAVIGIAGYESYTYVQSVQNADADFVEYDDGTERVKRNLLVQAEQQIAKLEDILPDKTERESGGRTVESRVSLEYLAYLPRGYDDLKREWPLILFLHGSGNKGNIKPLYNMGPISRMMRVNNGDFICVSPVCPVDGGWSVPQLTRFINEICARYPIDEDRIYLTGMSMGGHGTWMLLASVPSRFAAAAPVCGSWDALEIRMRASKVPIWLHHGRLDTVVPVERAFTLIAALESVNPHFRHTIYPDYGHAEVLGIYERPELYLWFYTHSKDPDYDPFRKDDSSTGKESSTP